MMCSHQHWDRIVDPHKHLVWLQSAGDAITINIGSGIPANPLSTYLTGCSNMPRNADIYGKAGFKWTSTRRFALFVEIIISFKIKDS